MTELPEEAAKLLERARTQHDPSEHERARVLSRLHATLGLGAASPLTDAAPTAGDPGGGATSAAQAKGFGTLLGGKAVKLLLAGVALGTAISLVPAGPPKPQTAPSKVQEPVREPARPAEPPVPPAGAARPEPLGAALPERETPPREGEGHAESPNAASSVQRNERVEPAAVVSEDAERHSPSNPGRAPRESAGRRENPSGLRVVSPTAPRAREGARAEEATPASTTVASVAGERSPTLLPEVERPAELTLIRRALVSLRDHQPERALQAVEQHAEQYARGAFATEREGLRVLALCEAGRLTEARAAKAAFLRKESRSPIAARVRRACVEAP